MVMIGKNNCKFIITRGETRVCNKKCREEYCHVHAKLMRDHNPQIQYSFCPYCGKRNRSKYGICFVCYHAKNVRYHTLKNSNK